MNHSQKAMDLFQNGCNCSQAVFAAFCDETGMEYETALKLASSFGGGMGRLREVCGAVTGMFMIAGLKYGYVDLNDTDAKAEHYQLIQSLAKEFKDRCGSIICRELLEMNEKATNILPESGITASSDTSPIPSPRTESYYAGRPCAELVGVAAKIMEDSIKSKEKYKRLSEE